MEPRKIHAEVDRLARERGWAQDSPQEMLLLDLFAAREDARYAVLRHASVLRQDLDRLEKIMKAESPILNTLGELQQRPAAVEAAVGEFAAADKALAAYLKAFPGGA